MENMGKITNNFLLKLFIIFIVFIGIVLRFKVAQNSCIYWQCDDVSLISQAIKFSYTDLFTKPLNGNQVCPPLFIMTSKFLGFLFGINHFALGLIPLLSSCLSLIFMPIITCKLYKSKILAIIATAIIVFNPLIIYYTQRLKQYTTDIFLTIFLIYVGIIFFLEKTKLNSYKKMMIFTVICIICGLLSYTSMIFIFCLCFYYFILSKEDNLKTKFINFLIFSIPFFIIFITYLKLVGIANMNNPAQTEYWNYYFSNFEDLKHLFSYLFNSSEERWYYYFSNFEDLKHLFPYLFNISEEYYFWYLFIPVLIGILLIIKRKNRYLFSILILPIITAQCLGLMHIYPFTPDRVCIYIIPVCILLFVSPFSYIQLKYDKKIFLYIFYIFTILYCSIIVCRLIINHINSYYYWEHTAISAPYIEELKKSDIKDNDVICCGGGCNELEFFVFDLNGQFRNNPRLEGFSYDILKEGTYYYMYLYKIGVFYNDEELDINDAYKRIKEYVDIIYEYDNQYGDKFIKAKKKKYDNINI